MILTPALKHSSVRALEQGELCLAHTGDGQALMLALSPQSEIRKAFCVIPLADEAPPRLSFSHARDGSQEVLSYGLDWVVEARPDANSRYGNPKAGEIAGAIVLTKKGPLLTVSNGDRSFDLPVSINLEKGEIDHNPQQGWPTLDWRIWACADDRKAHNGLPLYVCPATSE